VYPLTVALVIGTKPLGDEIRPVLQAFGCRVVLDQNDVGDWNEFLGKLDRLRPNVVLYDVARLQEGMEEPPAENAPETDTAAPDAPAPEGSTPDKPAPDTVPQPAPPDPAAQPPPR